jgi:hypothetical protein
MDVSFSHIRQQGQQRRRRDGIKWMPHRAPFGTTNASGLLSSLLSHFHRTPAEAMTDLRVWVCSRPVYTFYPRKYNSRQSDLRATDARINTTSGTAPVTFHRATVMSSGYVQWTITTFYWHGTILRKVGGCGVNTLNGGDVRQTSPE